MKKLADLPRIKGFDFPRLIIFYAAWAPHRFNLSTTDAEGNVLDFLVQSRCNAMAAKRFFLRLVGQFGSPRVILTDNLRSRERLQDRFHLMLIIEHTRD